MSRSTPLEVVMREKYQTPYARTRRVLLELTHHLLDEVAAGRSVVVPGLGTFSKATRKARRIRNPVTKELMQLSETTTVKFTAAKAAKEKVR